MMWRMVRDNLAKKTQDAQCFGTEAVRGRDLRHAPGG